jgi:hypothetical protein
LFAPSVLWRQKDFTFMQRKSMLEANILQLETGEVTSSDWHLTETLGSIVIWLNGLGFYAWPLLSSAFGLAGTGWGFRASRLRRGLP